jgi:hypothetical protein
MGIVALWRIENHYRRRDWARGEAGIARQIEPHSAGQFGVMFNFLDTGA